MLSFAESRLLATCQERLLEPAVHELTVRFGLRSPPALVVWRPGVIVWLNGAFGVGKTTVSGLLAERLPDARVFDPEWVGYMLKANVQDREYSDFQQLPPWRTLVPVVIGEMTRWTGQHVVAPQSVLVEEYWRELTAGSAAQGLELLHVVLDASRPVLEARIRADATERTAQGWRLKHVVRYDAARPWLLAAADLVVRTDSLTPAEVVDEVLAVAGRPAGTDR